MGRHAFEAKTHQDNRKGKRAKNQRPLAERSAAVRRILGGEYIEAIAAEHEVTSSTVKSWCDCWRYRKGAWHAEPLEQIEIDLGFEIAVDPTRYGSDRTMVHSLLDAPEQDEKVSRFLDLLGRVPAIDRKPLENAFTALDEHHRALLTPAFDTYQKAMDHGDEMRRLRGFALELAAAELVAKTEPMKVAA